MTIPNALTLTRLVAAVLAGAFFVFTNALVAAVTLCCIGMILDAADGWWARRFDEQSRLGIFLDPLADKVLMAVVYGALVAHWGAPEDWLLYILITIRDVGVTVSRAFHMQRNLSTSADSYGKTKMILQSVAGAGMLVYGFVWRASLPSGLLTAVLSAVMILSVLSARRHWLPVRSGLARVTPVRSRD